MDSFSVVLQRTQNMKLI